MLGILKIPRARLAEAELLPMPYKSSRLAYFNLSSLVDRFGSRDRHARAQPNNLGPLVMVAMQTGPLVMVAMQMGCWELGARCK